MKFLNAVRGASSLMNAIAAIGLTFIMLLTTLDVILRAFGKPILGTYELVAFTGGVIIGFAVPMTSWARAQIYVDFVVQRMSKGRKNIVNVFTRVAVILFFIVVSFNLFKHGSYLFSTGEVSPTLQIPFYPVVFGIGVAFVIECFVLIADIVKIVRGEYE